MWCTRYYAFIRNTKQIFNVKNNVLRCISENANSLNSCDNEENVNKPIICNNLLSSVPRSDERGYVEELHLNPNNDIIPMHQLKDHQTSTCNLIPRIETFSHDLNFSDEDIKLPQALDKCNEDVSDIGLHALPSFNIAKYANSSRTIQELMKLGVELYKHEKKNLVEFLLKADFDKDISPYIRFLHDCGVPADYLGRFFTKNPYIFKQEMDNLHTRIRYLRFHDYTLNMIKTIICKNPLWLNYNTQFIDTRLGYFQHNFKLSGAEVRKLSVMRPVLITYNLRHINQNTFAVKEEMGFDDKETKMILLQNPTVWIKCRKNIVNTFDYAHNEMKLSHAFIASNSYILLCRKIRLKQRHMFLVKLGRAQYDPTVPLYVSPKDLICGSDAEFCKNVAKTNIEVYDLYLKSM